MSQKPKPDIRVFLTSLSERLHAVLVKLQPYEGNSTDLKEVIKDLSDIRQQVEQQKLGKDNVMAKTPNPYYKEEYRGK